MRTLLLVSLVAAMGCGGQPVAQQEDHSWTTASAALQAHGIYSLSTTTHENTQLVELHGSQLESLGTLTVTQGSAGHAAALTFGPDTWSQSFTVGEQASLTIALNGAQVTFKLDGSAWVGDAAAQALMTRSQPFIKLASLVGSEAHLTISTPAMTTTPSAPPPPASVVTPAPDHPTPTPNLVCTNLVVAAVGAAFYFDPADMACRRAQDGIALRCHVATTPLATPRGLDCCNTPEPPCFNQVSAGQFTLASASGYLSQLTP